MSVDYCTRLERGNLGGVSEGVLDALARALQLDEAERGHLFDLARAANVARFVFLSPRAQEVFPDWESTANDLVANLRTEAGRNPP